MSDVPDVAAIDEQSSEPPSLLSNLGNRLGRWALDALDVLPDRHEFMDPLTSPDGAPHSPLWLAYGDNRLRKQDSSYLSFYKNDDFSLKLTLRPAGPADAGTGHWVSRDWTSQKTSTTTPTPGYLPRVG